MLKRLKYFFPKHEMAYFEKLKTIFFINQAVVGILILIAGLIRDLILVGENFMNSFFSELGLILLLIAMLFTIKSKGLKVAGNIYSFVIVFILLASVNILPENISPIFKYAQGVYSVFVVLIVGVLFVSRWVLLSNALLIFISTTHVFIFAKNHSPENIDFFTTGYISHTIALVFITTILYFTSKLAEKAVQRAKDETNKVLRKNMVDWG